jgi:hypothetical protein
MTFAYPIYTDKTSKDSIRFYHCSDKKSKVRTLSTNFPCGTILDSEQNLLFTPTISVDAKNTHPDSVKLLMVDGTVVHLYNIEGEWYMGTKNSWNISSIYDISPTNYGEYFMEAAAKYDFSYDNLDPTKMYTVIFTNPKCHLLANECKVYVYTAEDPLAEVFEVLPTTDDTENYVTLSSDSYRPLYGSPCRTINIFQSELRKNVMNLLYRDRKKCYSKSLELSFAKLYITALCNCKTANSNAVREYLMDHSNDMGKKILGNVLNVAAKFNEDNNVIDEFLGKSIPIDLLNQSHDSTLFQQRHIGFFVSIYRSFVETL